MRDTPNHASRLAPRSLPSSLGGRPAQRAGQTPRCGAGRWSSRSPSDPGHLNPAITTSGATHTAAELIYNGLLGRDERGTPCRSWPRAGNRASGRGLPLPPARRCQLARRHPLHGGRRQVHLRGGAAQVPRADQGVDGRRAGRHRGARRPDGHLPLQAALRAPAATSSTRPRRRSSPRTSTRAAIPQTNPANASPVGTGPFKFVAYKKGAEIRLARNPAYFKRGLPYLDELVMRVIPDAGTQVLALENGEVDFLWGVPGPHQSRLRRDARFRMAQTVVPPRRLELHHDDELQPRAADPEGVRVRQAIAHALDREAFLRQVLFGEGKVAAAPDLERDPVGARARAQPATVRPGRGRAASRRGRLEEGARGDAGSARGVAGVADGTRLSIDFLHFPTFAKYGELMRQQLGAVGIGVTLRPLEPAVFAPDRLQGPHVRHERHLVLQWPRPRDRRAPDVPFLPDRPGAVHERGRLPQRARRCAVRSRRAGPSSANARSELYRQIQEILVQELPYFWLVETPTTRAWAARCGGFKAWTGLFAEEAFCKR